MMNFVETRGTDGQWPLKVSLSSAILGPMASFGGIFVPQILPDLEIESLQKYLEAD